MNANVLPGSYSTSYQLAIVLTENADDRFAARWEHSPMDAQVWTAFEI
jgi:hypothetical protein